MTTPSYEPGIEITGPITPEYARILTPEAMAFAARLQRAFGPRRDELLQRRVARQAEFDAGEEARNNRVAAGSASVQRAHTASGTFYESYFEETGDPRVIPFPGGA